MIQRYKMTIETEAEWVDDALEYAKLTSKADNNGEWVKWEDIKHLIQKDDTDFIRKCIDEDTPVPPGIWYCDWNKINIKDGVKLDGCCEIISLNKEIIYDTAR